MIRAIIVPMIFMTIAVSGCAHTHLRVKTVKQSNTVNNIFEKQVLDNLAMFVVEPNSVPSFAYPKEGNTNVQDSVSLKGSPFDKFREIAGIDGSRSSLGSWGLQPITDPDKLRLMRCAYQRAVGCLTDDPCVDCCGDEKKFIGKTDRTVAVTKIVDGKPVAVNDPLTGTPYVDPATGNLATYPDGTPVIDPKTGLPKLHIKIPRYDCDGECAVQCGWLCRERRLRDVPLGSRHLVGSYRGQYVWIHPDGYNEFAKLVMKILDYATNDPPKTAVVKKEVQFYIDADGNRVKKADAVGKVVAVIDVGEKHTSILAENTTLADIKAAKKRALAEEISMLSISVLPKMKNFNPAIKSIDTFNNMDDKAKTDILNKDPQLLKEYNQLSQIKSEFDALGDLKQLETEAKFAPPAMIQLPKERTETPSFGPSSIQLQRRLNAVGGGIQAP